MHLLKHSKYNPDRFTRQSLRLPTRDYTAKGAYYVTIRTDQFQPLFEIPELRKILVDTWNALPKRFPSVTLDEFVIMPDHIHFILWLDHTQPNAPTLGSVVGAYKSLVSVTWIRHIESHNIIEYPGHIWQNNFYERIVRKSELERTRLYIRNNPTRRKNATKTHPPEM
jgi:REP element-mobilizing transposase RayT